MPQALSTSCHIPSSSASTPSLSSAPSPPASSPQSPPSSPPSTLPALMSLKVRVPPLMSLHTYPSPDLILSILPSFAMLPPCRSSSDPISDMPSESPASPAQPLQASSEAPSVLPPQSGGYFKVTSPSGTLSLSSSEITRIADRQRPVPPPDPPRYPNKAEEYVTHRYLVGPAPAAFAPPTGALRRSSRKKRRPAKYQTEK